MRFTTIFFDLDDTLYPSSTGLWQAIGGRISLYMTERMGFPADQVVTIREKYFQEFGTTLRGLQARHSVDMDDYLTFVHDVPLDHYLSPDPAVHEAISSLHARKFILTNADSNHARRVLDATGLQGLFEGIIDIHSMAPFCKPMPEAFDLALKAVGSPEVSTCVLLDDQMRITRAARAIGMYTILVGKAVAGIDADAALQHLVDLPGLLDGRV